MKVNKSESLKLNTALIFYMAYIYIPDEFN